MNCVLPSIAKFSQAVCLFGLIVLDTPESKFNKNEEYTIFRLTIFLGIFEINLLLSRTVQTSFSCKYCWMVFSYFILKKILFLFNLGKDVFTILLSSRIISRDIVSIFLGTQSKDIILIFFKRKIYFAKRFLP